MFNMGGGWGIGLVKTDIEQLYKTDIWSLAFFKTLLLLIILLLEVRLSLIIWNNFYTITESAI